MGRPLQAQAVPQPDLVDSQPDGEDQVENLLEQESFEQLEAMKKVSREQREMKSKFLQATSSEQDIDRVIEDTR